MAKKLSLVNGIPKMTEESASLTIYDQTLLVVSSAPGAGEVLGPITAGDPITLPSGKTYTSGELEIFLNGDRMTYLYDYTYYSTTQIAFTFQILVKDLIRMRIDRAP